MKLKVKGKRFFKELKSLYKEKSRNYSVSPEQIDVVNIYFDDEPALETSEPASATATHSSHLRKVGKSSYRKTAHYKLNKPKRDAAYCFKVLGLKTFPNSNKVKLIDTLNGKVYNTNMPNLTKNAYAYDSRREALSERLPSRLVGARSSERLCRVLVSFECWGETHRRIGGGNGCSEYEFLKFMKIEQSLDSPAQHSMKSTNKPVPPHYYPTCDKSFGKSPGKSTRRNSTARKNTTRNSTGANPTNPEFRTAIMTKEVRLKVVFSKDVAAN